MPRVSRIDRKGSRQSRKRAAPKKIGPHRRKKPNDENRPSSRSGRKLRLRTSDLGSLDVDEHFQHVIIKFHSVFSELSKLVRCKKCGGNVSFRPVRPSRQERIRDQSTNSLCYAPPRPRTPRNQVILRCHGFLSIHNSRRLQQHLCDNPYRELCGC